MYMTLQEVRKWMGAGIRWDKRRMGMFSLSPVRPCRLLNPRHRKEKGPISRQEYLRIRFYKNYQKEAEEYDREFMKKYDDDLNTTLIFVSLAHRMDTRVLIWMPGRSVFRCDLRIHRHRPL